MLSQAKSSQDILWITTGPGDVEYCLIVSIKAGASERFANSSELNYFLSIILTSE